MCYVTNNLIYNIRTIDYFVVCCPTIAKARDAMQENFGLASPLVVVCGQTGKWSRCIHPRVLRPRTTHREVTTVVHNICVSLQYSEPLFDR